MGASWWVLDGCSAVWRAGVSGSCVARTGGVAAVRVDAHDLKRRAMQAVMMSEVG